MFAPWEYPAMGPFLGAADGSSLGGRASWRALCCHPRQRSLRALPVRTVTAELKETLFDKGQEPVSQLCRGVGLAGKGGGLAGQQPPLAPLHPPMPAASLPPPLPPPAAALSRGEAQLLRTSIPQPSRSPFLQPAVGFSNKRSPDIAQIQSSHAWSFTPPSFQGCGYGVLRRVTAPQASPPSLRLRRVTPRTPRLSPSVPK